MKSKFNNINKIAESVDKEADLFDIFEMKFLSECIKKEKYNEAVDVCIKLANHDTYPFSWYYEVASCICCEKLNDFTKGLEYYKKYMEIENCPDHCNRMILHLYKKYYINWACNNIISARKDCLTVMLDATVHSGYDGELIKDEATKDFCELEKSYVDSFLDLPYNERKVLMPVKEYVDLHQDRVSVIRMDNLPAIKFPMGHPIANQLYVGHPLIPSKYIPFENYQLELVEDKVREFCMLAQSLGATEISIECLNSSSSNEMGSNKQNISGEAGTRLIKGKGEYHQDRSRQMIDELSHSICIHQTFTPSNKPFVPENMVWYDEEPSWQRLVSQRLSGGLTSHEERIETKKSQMVEGRELTELKAEVNSLYVDMKMSISEEEEAKFTQQENAVLAIKVQFAPINQLTGTVIESNSNLGGTVKEKFNSLGKFAKKMSSNIVDTVKTVSSLTSSEKQYLKELKDILSDGEISSRERRLLEKIRVQLGISEDRSAELENSLMAPALTPEEQEYFDEYQEIISDGKISDRDQRFLDKLKKANDISEKRAKEIEDMVCAKI